MMLDIKIDTLRQGFWRHFPLAATLGALVVLEMAAVLMTGFRLSEAPAAAQVIGQTGPISNSKELGKLLYTQYIYPVQVAAAILLVAMIAAIALTLRARKDTKTIDASEQVRVKAGDRLQVLKMEVTRQAPATAPEEKKS
jgi:NADH-quinone oxidoreductase subunit J